jgi:RimJ/RimL family protein N-acetyltransferase/predicted GNAT family acetyltransferase
VVAGQILDFRRRLRESVAERRVLFDGGIGLFCDSMPQVYDANLLAVDHAAEGAALAARADELMEPFFHRRVTAETAGSHVGLELAALGWTTELHVVMAAQREPDRRVDTRGVREVPFEAVVPLRRELTTADYGATDELARQLDELKRRVAAAVPTRYFVAYAGDEPAAYCELRSDGRVAQIEDVNTLPRFRGRGLGRAIVQHALDAGRRSSALVFLDAVADDWPRQLYAKLGFDVVADRHIFSRLPHPLAALRLRTPRLELRLATVAELRELARVAADEGVLEGELMPFEVAWTDAAGEPGFVDEFLAFHQAALQQSRPDKWRLELVAFLDSRPIGVQGVGAERFAATREVHTGSWLGRPYQRRGLGTEMRNAVLSLAFDRLAARVAWSGAHPDNRASLGVSGKLGYRAAGTKTAHPRGEPVEHRLLRLDRKDFEPLFEVEVTAPDDVLRFLGAT